jgi:hypothetical protein
MSIRSKSLLTVVLLAVTVSISCGNKEGAGAASVSGAASPATPPPLAAGISQNLTKRSTPPFYNFDSLGPISYPAVQKSNQVSRDTEVSVTGWALDESKKGTAGGVDVVIDQVPYSAQYGDPRKDVADHFSRPDYVNSGFHLILARGQLNKGPHSVSVRVISSDKKSYNEGPVVQFAVN